LGEGKDEGFPLKPHESYKNRKMTGALLGYAEISRKLVGENGDKKFT
jgi:hypothetical protein